MDQETKQKVKCKLSTILTDLEYFDEGICDPVENCADTIENLQEVANMIGVELETYREDA